MEMHEAHYDHILTFRQHQRVAVANEWNLVEADTVESDMLCERDRLRDLLQQLPEGRDLEPRGRDRDAYEHRLALCGEWDLEPVEQWRLDSFIYAMAGVEIERRLREAKTNAKACRTGGRRGAPAGQR